MLVVFRRVHTGKRARGDFAQINCAKIARSTPVGFLHGELHTRTRHIYL